MLEEPGKEEGTGRRLLIFNCDKLVVPKPLVSTLIDIGNSHTKGSKSPWHFSRDIMSGRV